jgi:uroporphyrinogen-III synthase
MMPEQFDAESLVEEFQHHKLGDTDRVLFPCSSKALDTIPNGLMDRGARVDSVVAYETNYATLDGEACIQQIKSGAVDAITFTSPSAIAGLISSLGDDGFQSVMQRVPAVVIGPSTERVLREAGSVPAAVASPSTFDGLVDSLATYFDKEQS